MKTVFKGADAISMMNEIQTTTQDKLANLADQLKQEHEFVTEVNSIFMKDYYTYCEPQKIANITVQGTIIHLLQFVPFVHFFQLSKLAD